MDLDSTFLENIANFATFAGLVAVAYQIYMSKKEQRIQHEKQEKQKAIELAELYANKIMDDISFLSSIYKKSNIEKYFEKINYNELSEFDRHELKKIFKGYDIDKINYEILNIDDDILLKAIISMKSNLNKEELNNHLEAFEINKLLSQIEEVEKEVGATLEGDEGINKKRRKAFNEIKKKYRNNKIYCKKIYHETLDNTLNTLEYFCMYFNSGVADEEFVYQSLHQSFLSMVKILYFRIAYVNESGKDKYYTNIIELYNKWSYRYYLDEEDEVKAKRNLVRKPKKIRK